MATKKLEPHIIEAFKALDFTDEEIKNGCWLLERNSQPIAWICLHKFLERVAIKAHIEFDEPKVFNLEKDEIALYVKGSIIDGSLKNVNSAWAIGEASSKNCKNDYRWAMAEKRAKDRVILKLLGVSGDMYSEEEADDFKKKPDAEVENLAKEMKAEQTAVTKAVKKGEPIEDKRTVDELKSKFDTMKKFIVEKKLNMDSYKSSDNYVRSYIDSVNRYIKALNDNGLTDMATEIGSMLKIDDKINF